MPACWWAPHLRDLPQDAHETGRGTKTDAHMLAGHSFRVMYLRIQRKPEVAISLLQYDSGCLPRTVPEMLSLISVVAVSVGHISDAT